jgi:hypothetical protein
MVAGGRHQALSQAARGGVNLDDRALDPAEIERRQAAVSVFAGYLAEQSKPAVHQLDAGALCEHLVEYGKALFADGAARHCFLYAILGCQDKRRELRGHLQKAWDINHTWQALTPTRSHRPLPTAVWRALVSLAIHWGWLDLAVILLLMFLATLRPREAYSLFIRDLILPGDMLFVVEQIIVVIHSP